MPNATVIGIDGVPSIAEAGNVLLTVARAKVELRIAAGADPEAEITKLMDYLREQGGLGYHPVGK